MAGLRFWAAPFGAVAVAEAQPVAPATSTLAPGPSASPTASPSAEVASVLAKAGRGQKPLRVVLTADGKLRARACADRACARGSDTELTLPADVSDDLTRAKIQELRIGQERRVVWLQIPSKPSTAAARTWHAVLGVRPGSAEASLLFQGWDGYAPGVDGERRGVHVQPRKVGKSGNVTLLVSDLRESLTLCGRPALLAPRALSGHDLKFHGATISRLPSKERAGARKLKARPVPSEKKAGSPGLLTAVAASSAIGNPAYLTDGDDKTAWAEARTGDGRGEFVIMRASSGVPLSGFEFTVGAEPAKQGNARSPDEVWVATDDALFEVQFPPGAFSEHGTYAIDLPTEVTTQCVAIVLGRTRRARSTSEVSLTEVTAISPLASEPIETLVAALDSDAWEPAVGMLIHRGDPGFAALAKAYPGLNPRARARALSVLDHAPCEFSGATYAEALLGTEARERAHAAPRVGRCQEQATEVFVLALDAPGLRSQRAAEQLSNLDPGRAVEEIVIRLPTLSLDDRRLMLPILARAASAPRAHAAVRSALARDLPPDVTTVVLRLAGPDLAPFQPEAGAAFARLSAKDLDFRSRYLLVEPAASLASSDPSAAAFIRSAIERDPDPRVRARAAEKVSDPRHFVPALIVATNDEAVRVREAATRGLGGAEDATAEEVLRVRLLEDTWPIVRVAAADALRESSPGGENDEVLIVAMEDPSRHVRQAAILALGARGARGSAPLIRARVLDAQENADVRSAAAHSLASLCDTASIDALTTLALAAATPGADESSQLVSAAALRALGRLHPADLDARIAPLLAKDTPAMVRSAAQRAQSMPGTCGASAGK